MNSKFNLINIPVRKKKRNVSRLGGKYEKSKAAADTVIKDIKSFLVNTVDEELVLQDDFYFEAPKTFTTNIEKIINVSSDSKGKTNSEFSKSLTTRIFKEDLKTISKKQMLTDSVINVLQKMLKKQSPDVNGLPDPLLGQLLSYQIYQNTAFVQVIHNGCYHWLVFSTYRCNEGEIFVLDSKFNYLLSIQTIKQICALLRCLPKTMVTILPFQRYIGRVDCSLFAIAFQQIILSCKQNPMGVSLSNRV